MWNIIAANRLLQQKTRSTQYSKHKKTLAEIKPLVDNLPPQHFEFLNTRPKAKQQATQLNMTVLANNRDLVRRMMRPKSGISSANKRQSKSSLHATYFKFVAAQIDDENRKLLSRLQETTSRMNFQQMQCDHKKHLRWKNSHKKPPCQFEKMRPMSAR